MDNEIQCYDGDGTTTPELKTLLGVIERLKQENTNLRIRHDAELDARNRSILHLSDKITRLEQKLLAAKNLADSRRDRLMKISHSLYSREDFRETDDFRSLDDEDCQDQGGGDDE